MSAELNVKDSNCHHSQSSVESANEEKTLAAGVQYHPGRKEAPALADHLSSSQGSTASMPNAARELPGGCPGYGSARRGAAARTGPVIDLTLGDSDDAQEPIDQRRLAPAERTFGTSFNHETPVAQNILPGDNTAESGSFHGFKHLLDSQESSASATELETRRMAFNAMMDASNLTVWPGLISTTNNHTRPESELGEG